MVRRPFQPRNILVPIDLTPASHKLIRYAAMLGEAYDSSITVMHAVSVPMYPQQLHLTGDGANAAFAVEKAKAEEQIRDMLTEHPHKVKTLVVQGDPVPEIARVARSGFDLIVIGTHARKGLPRLLLGSVAEGVLRQASAPVITVHPSHKEEPSRPAVRSILCPVNFSLIAMKALEAAVALARAFEAELILLHVIEESDLTRIQGLDDRMSAWIPDSVRAESQLRYRVRHGNAAEEVLAYAHERKSDLIVLGAQHRPFRDTTVVGTTTERITRYAKCPVLTVTDRKPAETLKRRTGEPIPIGIG